VPSEPSRPAAPSASLPPRRHAPAPRVPRTALQAPGAASAPLLKVAVWLAGLLPLVVLLRRAFAEGLGADPIETLTHHTGWWGLVFLLATLAVTPLRRLTGWNRVIGVRRLLGLFAFFYVALHFGVYLLDQEMVFAYVREDVLERPYITAGFTAFVLMIPLAVTSTRGMIRRLGGKRWQRLHRLVYASAVLGVVHFLWSVKADVREPLVFAGVLAVLLALRLPWTRRLPVGAHRDRDGSRARAQRHARGRVP
jgi:methionine sulfoxide reductase heme-binding subunit